jgi:hypothetical protein
MKKKIDEKDKASRVVGEALIIGLVTALGYISTYIANTSYLQYFGLPLSLAMTPPNEIIAVSTFLFLAAIMCALFSWPIYRFIGPKTEKKADISRHLWSMFIAYLIPYAIIKVAALREISWSAFIEFCFVIIISWLEIKTLSYIARYFEEKKVEKSHRSEIMFLESHIKRFFEENDRVGGLVFSLLIMILLVVILSFDIGMSSAQQKTSFSIINGTSTPLVVIIQSGDLLVAAPITSNKQLINQIHLINLNTLDSEGLYLSQQKIGPLQPIANSQDPLERWFGLSSSYTWPSAIGF